MNWGLLGFLPAIIIVIAAHWVYFRADSDKATREILAVIIAWFWILSGLTGLLIGLASLSTL